MNRERREWRTVAVAIIVTAAVIVIGIATGNRASAASENGSRTVAIVYGCHAEDDCHADYRRDGSWRIIRNGHR